MFAAAEDREVVAIARPVEEQLEGAEPFRSDERLGSEDRHAQALGADLQAHALGADLGLAIGADPLQPIVLVDRVMVGNAVDGGRRDVDEARDAVLEGALQDDAGALDVGGEDLGPAVEGQRRGAMDDDVDPAHRAVDGRAVANVAPDLVDRNSLRIVERRDVERAHGVPARQQETDEVDAEEAGAAGEEVKHPDHAKVRWPTSAMPRTSSARPTVCSGVTASRRANTETDTTMTMPPATMIG